MNALYKLILFLVWPLLITTPLLLKSEDKNTKNIVWLAQEGFTADTIVKTTDGYKNIEAVTTYDQIIGYSKDTNQSYEAPVIAVAKQVVPTFVKIITNNDVIRAGIHQKFYLLDKKDFILAKDIKPGNYLHSDTSNSLVVKVESIDIPTSLYAITVEKSYFYITSSDIVVHNVDPVTLGTASTALTFVAGANPAGLTILGGAFFAGTMCFALCKIWESEYSKKVFKSKNNVSNNSPCECGCKCFDQSICACDCGCICQKKENFEGKKSDFFTNLKAKSDKKACHSRFGLFYRDPTTGFWWSKDTADHGGCTFKVFKKGAKGFSWKFDANASGEKILNKHKGPVGLFIPFKELVML